MKKIARVFLCVLVALLLALPAGSLAYWNAEKGEMYMEDGELPTIYGTLNRRMATREGPSTKYREPGTFLQEGDEVQIISLTYDDNDVPWVQVDFYAGQKHYRAYTGLKRFDGVEINSIPLEATLGLAVSLTGKVTPRHGPGSDYHEYNFTLGNSDRTYEMLEAENGYAMLQYYAQGEATWYRVWVPMDYVQ